MPPFFPQLKFFLDFYGLPPILPPIGCTEPTTGAQKKVPK